MTRRAGVTMRISLGAIAVLLAAGLAVPGAAPGTAAPSASRTATWGPSMTIDGPDFADETIRMVVHTTIGGSSVRIKLSNLRSTTPLSVGEVDVAAQAQQATAVAGSRHLVTFSHARTVTIPAGAEVFSDPIGMTVASQTSLLISLYLPQATSSATWHYD